ncbi:MAG: DUF86 domain-containing protein [Phycisphaerales bacterium]
MAAAANAVLNYTRGMTFEQFLADAKTRDATIRQVEILGESVKGVAKKTLAAMPGPDWKGLAGVRDVLIHQYFRVDPTVLWEVVQTDCPAVLAAALAELTKRGEPGLDFRPLDP